MATYTFGYGSDYGVECPELDAFLADIDAVLKKHGVGLELEGGYEESCRVVLVPYAKHDLDLAANLDDYGGGIPWLDDVRAAFEKKRDEISAQRQARQHAEAAEAKRAKEAALLRDGVMVDGRRYRLVETE